MGRSVLDHDSPPFIYRVTDGEGLDAICPLWQKLRMYHWQFLKGFPGADPPFHFEPRKREIVAKAAPGGLRVELVQRDPGSAEIAYCVSTVSTEGCGEVDSLFVDESFRGRGIGSELIRRAINWFETHKVSATVVSVAYGHEEALSFYRRFNFHPRVLLLQQERRD